MLCASKAYYTWNCFFGMEKIRQSAGGHGFSYYSGIPPLITEMSPCVAAEGDNTVLSLASAKAILFLMNKGKAVVMPSDENRQSSEHVCGLHGRYVHLLERGEAAHLICGGLPGSAKD